MAEPHRYAIEYSDDSEAAPRFRLLTTAYSMEHAIERFHNSPDSEGWRLHRIARVTDRPEHRWTWKTLNQST